MTSRRKTTSKKTIRDLKTKATKADKAKAVRGGKTSLRDFTIPHYIDKSSPSLG